MNLDDIIRLAGEAGLWLDSEGHIAGGQLDSVPRFAALVAEHERNACARVCQREAVAYDEPSHYSNDPKKGAGTYQTAMHCAAAIRARGQK